MPGHNHKLIPLYQYVLFFCLILLLAGCNSQADELVQASRSYKTHGDYASLEMIHRHLRNGMLRSKVEELLGEADYSPIAGQYYYSSDRYSSEQQAAGKGHEQVAQNALIVGLVVDYRNDQGELTWQLQSFWLGPIGE